MLILKKINLIILILLLILMSLRIICIFDTCKYLNIYNDPLYNLKGSFFNVIILLNFIYCGFEIAIINSNQAISEKEFLRKYLHLAIITTTILNTLPIGNLCYYLMNNNAYIEFEDKYLSFQNISISIINLFIIIAAFKTPHKFKFTAFFQLKIKIIKIITATLIVSFLIDSMLYLHPYINKKINTFYILNVLINNLIKHYSVFLPLLLSILFLSYLRHFLKVQQFKDLKLNNTSGQFGSASFATLEDLEQFKVKDNYAFMGVDDKNNAIYLPLYSKVTISPPGGGKTSSSSIPILLTHNGPAFVFDVKGELWAVTARYRHEIMGRKIVVIDPFNITHGESFSKDKDPELLQKYYFNPFDWIPEDKKERDRFINNFASSFVINEGGASTHFDENAKILIRGYIDYIMTLEKKDRTLSTLYTLISENSVDAEITYNQMAQLDGRAKASANQIQRVGQDERGSILSTSYRQIDWMGDRNLQETLSHSNFNLEEFLDGNLDIFVILPEDQVEEHNRLIRMLLSLLMSLIVRRNPKELPKNKILFLLEELAQLGYTPDVEKCIEVLRARGVVVWTVFQALSQIEAFKKTDLFKGAHIKQIFTNDDTKTMEWIQNLGGKKTIVTKTLSNNKGDSRKEFQTFGTTLSSGEGESIQETGVDLIPLNLIRELPFDEQFIFIQGFKPIRCKKVRYFEHPDFEGKYDPNPLETKTN